MTIPSMLETTMVMSRRLNANGRCMRAKHINICMPGVLWPTEQVPLVVVACLRRVLADLTAKFDSPLSLFPHVGLHGYSNSASDQVQWPDGRVGLNRRYPEFNEIPEVALICKSCTDLSYKPLLAT